MLAIGRALVARPSLLMLDEPSLGSPPVVTLASWRCCGVARPTDLTVLLVEQNVRSALAIADEAVVLASVESLPAPGRTSSQATNAATRLPGVLDRPARVPTCNGLACGAVYAAFALALVLIWRAHAS